MDVVYQSLALPFMPHLTISSASVFRIIGGSMHRYFLFLCLSLEFFITEKFYLCGGSVPLCRLFPCISSVSIRFCRIQTYMSLTFISLLEGPLPCDAYIHVSVSVFLFPHTSLFLVLCNNRSISVGGGLSIGQLRDYYWGG